MSSDQVLKVTAGPRASRLLALPVEILQNIGAFLHGSSHLNNLSRTCKELRFITQPLLYRDFSLALPRDWPSVAICEHLLDEEANGLQWTLGISVSIRPDLLRKQAYGNYSKDERRYQDDEDENEEPQDSLGQTRFQYSFLNMLIRCIIRKVPQKCLRYFHWRHPTKLSQLTIKLLAQRHGMTIKDLHISKFSSATDTRDLPFYGLEKLHVADMEPSYSVHFVPRIMISSHSSLKHLKLGCERFIARPCLLGGNPLAEEELYDFTDEMLGDFKRALKCTGRQRSGMLLQLETVHLIGFDFRKLTTDSEAPFLELSELSRLEVLTLESCFIEGATLSLLSPQTALGLTWTPRLQSFHLRYEKSDAMFQHQVRAFLGSFTGLVHLSVLLEGSGGYIDPDCFIENHGRTLKTLVWDQRSKPRTLVGQSTSIPLDHSFRYCIYAIARGCPGLRELGLSLPYAIGSTFRGFGALQRLNDLRTLNIRNFLDHQHPFKDPCDFWIVQQHASVAGLVAEEILAHSNTKLPKLNIIALGAVTYKDRWLGRTEWDPEKPLDFYLCPRYYHVQYPVNIKGCRQPLLTPIAQGTADEAKEYSSDLRIFEPYWLN